jgi:hypothetical protein
MNPMNSNYDDYLRTATQLQRWRDFQAHLAAYVVVNILFVAIWAASGEGFFWPAFPLLGWAVGLSFQHFHVALRGQITDADVKEKLRPKKPTSSQRTPPSVAERSRKEM